MRQFHDWPCVRQGPGGSKATIVQPSAAIPTKSRRPKRARPRGHGYGRPQELLRSASGTRRPDSGTPGHQIQERTMPSFRNSKKSASEARPMIQELRPPMIRTQAILFQINMACVRAAPVAFGPGRGLRPLFCFPLPLLFVGFPTVLI